MKAALATRKGWRAAVGLAVQLSVSWSRWWCCGAGRRHTAQGHGRRLPCCGEHGDECVCVGVLVVREWRVESGGATTRCWMLEVHSMIRSLWRGDRISES
jgi:hypothetical protein